MPGTGSFCSTPPTCPPIACVPDAPITCPNGPIGCVPRDPMGCVGRTSIELLQSICLGLCCVEAHAWFAQGLAGQMGELAALEHSLGAPSNWANRGTVGTLALLLQLQLVLLLGIFVVFCVLLMALLCRRGVVAQGSSLPG